MDTATLYHNRGMAQADLGEHTAAISDYDTALERNPDLADAYRSRARSHQALGNGEAAARDLGEYAQRSAGRDAGGGA